MLKVFRISTDYGAPSSGLRRLLNIQRIIDLAENGQKFWAQSDTQRNFGGKKTNMFSAHFSMVENQLNRVGCPHVGPNYEIFFVRIDLLSFEFMLIQPYIKYTIHNLSKLCKHKTRTGGEKNQKHFLRSLHFIEFGIISIGILKSFVGRLGHIIAFSFQSAKEI